MKWAILNITSSIAPSEARIGDMDVILRVSARARRLRLRVDPRTRAVLLTVPRRTSRRAALAWAAEHREWLEQTLAAMPAGTPIVPDAVLPYRGRPLRVDWAPGHPRRIEIAPDRLIVGGARESLEGRMLRWLKAEALMLMRAETESFAALAGVAATRVGVGDPVSRWGSCASSGAVRYSWRLIMAPDFVRRATVAHEVAHLVHMNHGPDFHALVAELLGADPAPARAWLRREGGALHRIGRSG
jgi:predicted metal-dependent hydrolase